MVISTAERQVFDFLGYMWLPIIANFFNFIFVIFGFFGAYQYKTKYIVIYLVWQLVWMGWNVFVICFYLNVGILDNSKDWLNFGTGSASWWEVNGIGCQAVYTTNLTNLDPLRPMRPLEVNNCLVDYIYVETIHAGIQGAFVTLGLCVSIYLIMVFSEEDDSCKAKSRPTSIYSVEYSPQREGSESPDMGLDDSPYQQPMTPRRVKRQSRHRASGRSQTRSTQGRSSQRSRRHQYLNPVNRLMDKANESSTSTDSYHPNNGTRPPTGGRQGHSNPMYVHSRPNSTYSMNSSPPGHDPMERPPSVHSSYSNYHGQRPSINPNPYGRPPVQAITAGMMGGTHQRRSMMHANGHTNHHIPPGPTSTLGSIRSSNYSNNGTMKAERERPPPYMFGVNSETVI
ncbi:sodium/potassium-transporting ATPase subunit beta-1-interacting protein-like [Homarus americanus]|uniref:sodium/potassium-transporting ATPase subunit beta-1-interacting protein-like n=1 Tax=Homarus americanus TaxID=6706 RepID=UPI001C4943D3|nr:sodium/potassium-transporting ATPase subunit beta-1-interacting protein-like [Homarus americanus]